MIEAAAPEGGDLGAVAAQEQTAGAMLRAAREAAGLHVAALAVAMKVPVAKLDALESDRHELLPDAVFARALASSICRTLKIDPAPVLARLPRTGAPRLVQDSDGINAPFRSPRDAMAPHWKEQLTRPVSLIVGALLLGILVVLLWPQQPGEAPAVAGTAATEAAAAASSLPAMALVVNEAAAPPQVLTASATMPSPPAAAMAASGVIVFQASAPSWIEVRDARGAVPVRKLLAAGETAGVSGAMPLQVTVGNADATEVQVRGKPFDLRAIARDNVARFEVK